MQTITSPLAFVAGTAPDLIAVLDLFPKCAGCGRELHASEPATLVPHRPNRAVCGNCSPSPTSY